MYEQGSRGVDAPWPPARARAERWRSLSSCVRAAVYSCYLHGFCTNGLGDTGFVLLVLWPGMVANGRPWGRHPPGGRGSPGDDALAFTSTIHPAHTTQHTQDTSTITPPLVDSTPRPVVVSVCAAATKERKLREISWRLRRLDVHGNGKTPAAHSLQGLSGQEQQTPQKTHKVTKNRAKSLRCCLKMS